MTDLASQADVGAEAENVNGWCIEARCLVGQSHVAAARLLGSRHQASDLGQQRVLVGRGGLASQWIGRLTVPA